MAFNGYLLKVGNYTVPHSMMALESYSVSYLVQDLDSYRDGNGQLHRNALRSKAIKIEFQTKNMLTNTEFANLMSNIRSQFINANEKKVRVTCYIPETDEYVTQSAYIPDVTPEIYNIDEKRNTLYIKSTRLAFIGYGD